ncbi:MAG: hypothetical protein KDB53_15715 [Planctomycetes bacterium]|nr:hypothetical protein [Planctomycetota bacterium]
MMNVIGRTTTARSLVAVFVGLAILAGSSAAQNEPPDVTELLLKIKQLENRVYELETAPADTGRSELETRINALAESSGLAAPDNALGGFFKNETNFETEAKDFKIKFGGRIDFDIIFNTQDRALEQNFQHLEDGVNFRRTRLYMDVVVYKNIQAKIQLDFEDGAADFKDVFIRVNDVLSGGSLTFGQFKQPFSLEELTSAKYITFIERASPNVFATSRATGIMYDNSFGEDDRIWFGISVYRESDAFGDADVEPEVGDGDYAAGFRLTGLPLYEDGGETLIHLGISVAFQNPNDETVRFRQRPETSIGPRLIDTGAFMADDLFKFAVEAALVLGPFSAQAEYFHVFVNSQQMNDPDFWGGYLYLSYFITGEHRRYKNKDGAFDRVKPIENWHDGSGGGGAWEIGLRGSYVDLNDERINGGELLTLTFGLTWYWNPNTKVMFNYTYGNVDDFAVGVDDAEAHTLAIRFHIDF